MSPCMPRAHSALRAPPHVAPTPSPCTQPHPPTRHRHRAAANEFSPLPSALSPRHGRPAAARATAALPLPSPGHSLLGRAVQTFHHVHGSTQQLLGFLALAFTLTALFVLAGVTLTAALAALVLLSPLVLLTAPLWAPVAVVALLTGAASLLACCAGVAAVAAGTWAHRYFTGRHPVGVGAHRHRVESAAARGGTLADAASRVRGYYDAYAREYGGYPPRPYSRVKDAAPGA